jgi:hypothetical protein
LELALGFLAVSLFVEMELIVLLVLSLIKKIIIMTVCAVFYLSVGYGS